mmetsp:Transcript_4997/g.6303  ORF Transcript_4997/g.6303 Transcript_4997/m.6303 type:complete len:140 (-) Transcript_4997:176-595(-)
MPKEKKERKKKDPAAPKRGMSSYMFFSNDRRPELKADKPDLPFGEYAKIIGEEWRGLNESAKAPYEAKAAQDKARYEKEMKAYTKKNPKSPKKAKTASKGKEKAASKGKKAAPKKAASKGKKAAAKAKTPKKKTTKKKK